MINHKSSTVEDITNILNSDFPVSLLFKYRYKFQYYLNTENGASCSQDSYTINFLDCPDNPHLDCFNERLNIIHSLRKIITNSNLSEEVIFFLHGSYATGSITKFSDIDLGVIILSDQVSNSMLLKLRKVVRMLLSYIYSIDVLMHHGIQVFIKQNLDGFDQSMLPIEALKNSVLLYGPNSIKVTPDDMFSANEAKRKLIMQCEAVISFRDHKINHSLYKMKCLISVVLLIPVLLLEANDNEFLYKGTAINRARKLYSGRISFKAIDLASELRNDWFIPEKVRLVRNLITSINPIIPCIQNAQRISGVMAYLPKAQAKEFISEAKNYAYSVRSICND